MSDPNFSTAVKKLFEPKALFQHLLQFAVVVSIGVIMWRDMVHKVNAADEKLEQHQKRIEAVEDATIDIQKDQAVIKEKLETEQRANREFREETKHKLEKQDSKLDQILRRLPSRSWDNNR